MATGKSTVGKILEELGCHLILADELGHRTLAPGGEAYRPAVAEFGEAILDRALIDRKKLAAIVFADPAKLAKLNAIVHPAVERLRKGVIAEIVAKEPDAIVVVEAAIHIETGGYRNYDKLILVVCEEGEQIRRGMARDGATEAEVRARLGRQMPLAEKRKFADYVIENSNGVEDTRRQSLAVYNLLRNLVSPI